MNTDRPQSEARSGDSQEIERNRWLHFLDEFTRENRGAHARLLVIGPDAGARVEAEDRLFEGISADVKAGEHEVSITLGSSPDDHIERGIQSAKTIWLKPAAGEAGPTLEVASEDGTRTVLELTRAGDYRLSSAAGSPGRR